MLHKASLIIYIFLIFIVALISISLPYIIGRFMDLLVYESNIYESNRNIMYFPVIIGILGLVRIGISYITTMLYLNMRLNMGHRLNRKVIHHIHSLSLTYINHKDSVYLNQRINNDSNSLITFCISIMQSIITNLLMLVVPFVVLLNINMLVSTFMLGFIVLYIIIYLAFKKPLYNAGFNGSEAQAKFSSSLLEQLKYIKHIKINSIQNLMNARLADGFSNLKDAAIHNQKINYFYSSLDNFISMIAQVVLFVIGGMQVLSGEFTIGMFTIFTIYFNMILSASRYFFDLGASYQQTLVSYDRIIDILNQKPESCGTKSISNIREIKLQNLTFSYSLSNNNVFHNLNTTFTKGKIYVVIGTNGTGKSTLISLIIGLYIDEYMGKITYNGADIRDLDMATIRRKHISFAEQEALLLEGSIHYNVFLHDTVAAYNSINMKKLTDHINALDMQDFISKYGFDYNINEKNTNISGGEKQKISILKVLQKNSSVMIFDEPTSALDTQTTKKFIEHLQQIKKDKIIIIITHDKFVKEQCDDIITLTTE